MQTIRKSRHYGDFFLLLYLYRARNEYYTQKKTPKSMILFAYLGFFYYFCALFNTMTNYA